MTSRKEWKAGASSCILECYGGHTEAGFKLYEESGIDSAELSLSYEKLLYYNFYENPEAFLKMAESCGVKFWSFHIPFDGNLHPACLDEEENKFSVEVIEKSIRAAAKIGIKTMVIHPSSEPNDDETRQQRIERAIYNLTYFSKLSKELGATLAVENLPRTCLGNNSYEMLTFLNLVPDLNMCFDANHSLMQTNEDFLDDLIEHNMQGRIKTVHISDYDFINERHRLPFDGINDWEEIISKLEKLEYSGVFMYEVGKPADRERAYTLGEIFENYKKLIK